MTQSAKEPGIRAASTVADRVTETTRLTGIDMAAVSRAVARAWSLPPRRNRVTVVRGVGVPMSDGTGGDRGCARTSAPSDQVRGPDTRMVHR